MPVHASPWSRSKRQSAPGFLPAPPCQITTQSRQQLPQSRRAMPALILTVLPAVAREQRPFQTTPVSTLAGLPSAPSKDLPSFMAASVRRRRSHAFRGPVGLGFRPSNRRACFRFGPYGPQEIRLSALPFSWAIGSRLRWVQRTPGTGLAIWPAACGLRDYRGSRRVCRLRRKQRQRVWPLAQPAGARFNAGK